MNLPVIFAPEIIYRIEYIKSRNQFNTEGLSQWIDSLEWIVRFISNKSIAWDYAGQFKSDRYGNVYFNCFGHNLVFNLKEDEETTQLYVVIVEMDLNIEEFGLKESKQRNRTLIITEQQYNELLQMPLDNVKDMRTNESKVRRNVIRLTESMLKAMVVESLMNILNEYHEYKPVSRNKEITLNNGVKVKSLVTLSDGAGVYEIWEDDGCYVCCDMNYYRNNDDYHPMYIFPELLKALKDLPSLPLR